MRGGLAALALAASLGCGSDGPTAPTGAAERVNPSIANNPRWFWAAWQAWIRDRYFS